MLARNPPELAVSRGIREQIGKAGDRGRAEQPAGGGSVGRDDQGRGWPSDLHMLQAVPNERGGNRVGLPEPPASTQSGSKVIAAATAGSDPKRTPANNGVACRNLREHQQPKHTLKLMREAERADDLWYKLVELLHKANRHFESTKFVWRHGVGVEVHDIITNLSNILQQFGKNHAINSQIDLSPYLRMLE